MPGGTFQSGGWSPNLSRNQILQLRSCMKPPRRWLAHPNKLGTSPVAILLQLVDHSLGLNVVFFTLQTDMCTVHLMVLQCFAIIFYLFYCLMQMDSSGIHEFPIKEMKAAPSDRLLLQPSPRLPSILFQSNAWHMPLALAKWRVQRVALTIWKINSSHGSHIHSAKSEPLGLVAHDFGLASRVEKNSLRFSIIVGSDGFNRLDGLLPEVLTEHILDAPNSWLVLHSVFSCLYFPCQ